MLGVGRVIVFFCSTSLSRGKQVGGLPRALIFWKNKGKCHMRALNVWFYFDYSIKLISNQCFVQGVDSREAYEWEWLFPQSFTQSRNKQNEKKRTNKGKVHCHNQSRHPFRHCHDSSRHWNDLLWQLQSNTGEQRRGCERRLGRNAVKCSVFFLRFS